MHVFITRSILNSGIEYLKQNGHTVEVFEGSGPIDKINLFKGAKNADAIIAMLSDQIDAPFLEENRHLKVIANYAVGFNNIDLNKARELGIKVCNTPDVLSEATAEVALTLMLAVARNLNQSIAAIKNNQFKSFDPKGYLGTSLYGKTLGIIGMGRIGTILAKKAELAFSMKVIYHSRTKKENINYDFVSLDELFKNSDFISVHTDLNPTSKFLIDKKAFLLMKKNAILINTARGDIINQEDLYQALLDHQILGAGLDVTSPEPLPINHPLKSLTNCLILPHIGSATIETREAMSLLTGKNIQAVFEGKIPIGNVV